MPDFTTTPTDKESDMAICSGQDLFNSRDRNTCFTAPDVSLTDNTPKMPSGSHATLRRESIGSNSETHPNSEERTPSLS